MKGTERHAPLVPSSLAFLATREVLEGPEIERIRGEKQEVGHKSHCEQFHNCKEKMSFKCSE